MYFCLYIKTWLTATRQWWVVAHTFSLRTQRYLSPMTARSTVWVLGQPRLKQKNPISKAENNQKMIWLWILKMSMFGNWSSAVRVTCCSYRGPTFCFPASIWWFTAILNSSSWWSSTLFRPLRAPGSHVAHIEYMNLK